MLAILLCVEALEDNEVIVISGVMQVSKIFDPKGSPSMEKLPNPQLVGFIYFLKFFLQIIIALNIIYLYFYGIP